MGLYSARLVHKEYSIVCIAARAKEAATFIRRFLRHPAFDTKAKRMGNVVCLSDVGLRFWRLGEEKELNAKWNKE
jgi:hypothetical protein